MEGDHLYVNTSDACAIAGGGDRGLSKTLRTSEDDEPIVEANFELTPFRGSYCRVTVVDRSGQRAWSNQIWPS